MAATISLEEARDRLSRIGKTAGDVGRELGVSTAIVRGVLNGTFKGAHGDAHKVAVALGIKNGVIVDDRMSIGEAMKAAAA